MTDKVYMQILSPKLLLIPFFFLFFLPKFVPFFQGAGGGSGG